MWTTSATAPIAFCLHQHVMKGLDGRSRETGILTRPRMVLFPVIPEDSGNTTHSSIQRSPRSLQVCDGTPDPRKETGDVFSRMQQNVWTGGPT